MNRRAFIAASAAVGFSAPAVTRAQPAGRVYRIGYLSPGPRRPPGDPSPFVAALLEELRARGWVEGQNLAFDARYAGGSSARLHELAAELVSARVDLLLTWSQGLVAARQATNELPIVFLLVTDPVGLGYVASLRRPGGNATGISNGGSDLIVKRLQILKEMAPSVRRVAVLWHVKYASQSFWSALQADLERAALETGVALEHVRVGAPDELEGVIAAARRVRADALMNVEHQMFVSERRRVVGLAATLARPAVWDARIFAESGGLASHGPDFLGIWKSAGRIVDRVLRGARPADVPVEQPTKFELVINLKTAKALGLTIPPALLQRADGVIE